MGIIRRTFEYLDSTTFLLLYKALVRPHLEFGNCVWHPYKKKFIEMIENVQRRATRLLPGMKNLNYEQRLRTLGLPTLTYRRARGDMIEAFKIVHNKYDSEVTGNFLSVNTNQSVVKTRGHSLKIQQQYSKIKLRKHSFCVRVAPLWNQLPNSVVTAPSVQSFEKRLDYAWNNKPFKFSMELNSNDDATAILTEGPNELELAEEDFGPIARSGYL